MRKFKKFIALLMTVMMFISMLPMDALAEIIAGGGNASSGMQFPISVLSVVPDVDKYVTFEFYVDGTKVEDYTQIVKIDDENPQAVIEPATPEAGAGKRFDGWYVGEGENEREFSFGEITSASGYATDTPVKVTAKFTEVFYVYFLTTEVDGVRSVYATKEATEDNGYKVDLPEGYEPKDAVVTGWVIQGTNTPFKADTLVTADTYVTPVTVPAYWVTFNTDGGTSVDSMYVKQNESVDLNTVPKPTKVGYKFGGWKDKNDDPVNGTIRPTESIVLTAIWNADKVKYTVVYWGENADDDKFETLLATEEKQADTGTSVTGSESLPANAANSNYFTYKETETKTVAADGTTVVNVKFSRNTYKVTFNLGNQRERQMTINGITYSGGKNSTKYFFEAKFEQNIEALWPTASNFNSGSNFSGWSVNGLSGTLTSKRVTMTADLCSGDGKSATANYEASCQDHLYYMFESFDQTSPENGNDRKYYNGTYYDKSEGYSQDANSSGGNWNQKRITGMTAAGRQTDILRGESWDPDERNVFLYYTRNLYKLVKINNGSQKGEELKYGAPLDDKGGIPDEIPEGYTADDFKGWYTVEVAKITESTPAYDFAGKTMPLNGLTLYAYWVKPQIKVTINIAVKIDDQAYTFDKYGEFPAGTSIASTGIYTEALTFIADHKLTLIKWVDSDEKRVDINEPLYKTTVITPVFAGTTYELKYAAGEGTGENIVDQNKYGPDSLARVDECRFDAPEGKVFLHWVNKAGDIFYPGSYITMNANTTLTAVYGPVQGTVSVTYHANNGSEATKTIAQLLNNSQITTLDAEGAKFSKSGYTLTGWNTQEDGTGTTFGVGTYARVNNDGSNDLYAVWEAAEQEYTVEFYYQNKDNSETYDLRESRTATRKAKTDAFVEVTSDDKDPKDASYVHDEGNAKEVLSGTIHATGSLVLKLYFKLNTASYTIHHYLWTNKGATTIQVANDESGTMTIGETLDAAKFVKTDLGVTFEKYSPSQTKEITTNPDDNVIIIYYTDNPVLNAEGFMKVFDGEPHPMQDATVTGALEGQTFNIRYQYKVGTGNWSDEYDNTSMFEQTYVGVTDVRVIARNENYDDIVKEVKLEITPRPVTITVKSADRTYNGNPWTVADADGNEYTVEPFNETNNSGIVQGFEVEALEVGYGDDKADGKRDVGEYVAAIKKEAGEIKVTRTGDTSKENFAKNFAFKLDTGTLTITADSTTEVVVTIKGYTDTVTYNGQPHTVTGYDVTGISNTLYTKNDFSLKAGVEAKASDTNAGTYNMDLSKDSFVNTNANFTNVTFVVTDGWLKIEPVAIELTANSATKPYDGTPLKDGGYSISNGKFVDEEGLASVTVVGSQTVVGKNANKITGRTLKANTKEQNYTFAYVDGTLEVTPNEKVITVTANSHTWEYDGQPHSDGGYKVEYDGKTYTAAADGSVTLPTGDVVTATVEGTVTNVKDSADNNNVVTGVTIITKDGENRKEQYKTITCVPGGLKITARGAGEDEVVLTAKDNTVVYDGKAHGAKLNAKGEIEVNTSYTITNLVKGHSVKTVAINGSETNVGEYPGKLVPSSAIIVDGEGKNVTANYAITYVPGKLTITSPDTVVVTIRGKKEPVEYDGTKHEVNGYEVVNISNELYTAADFGLAEGAKAHAEGTDVAENNYPMNLTSESFVNKNNNFKNVTFVVEDGLLTITPRKVTLTSGSGEKPYNGTALTNSTVTVTGDGFVEGEGATYNVTGSQTLVGESDNTFTYKLNDGTKAGNYTIKPKYGTLTVTDRSEKYEITVVANSETATYDGTEHSAIGVETTTFTVEGQTYTVEGLTTEDPTETNASTYTNNISGTAVVKDKNGNDVTTQFKVNTKNGTLIIKPREVEITARSAEKEYDGSPLTEGEYVVTGGSVVDNYEFTVDMTAESTITNVGEQANVIATVDGAEVKTGVPTEIGNYKVTTQEGTLTITKRGGGDDETKWVKIIAADNTVGYDGNAHGALLVNGEIKLGTSYTTVRLVEGHYVDETTLDITGSQTNVGEYEDELKPAVKAGAAKIVIRDGNGADVTENYELKLVNGKLTITGEKIDPNKEETSTPKETNYKLGEKIEFTITVKNVSNGAVEEVTVNDPTAEIQEATDGSYTVSNEKHTATIAEIKANSEIKIKALHTVTSDDILAGTVGNTANVTWPDGTTEVSADTKKLDKPIVTMKMTKSSDWAGKADGEELKLGTEITYTITVKNTGNVPYTNVRFTDVLQNGDATVTGNIPVFGTLAVDEEKSFQVKYTVTEADLRKGSITNKVTATADKIEYTYYEGNTAKLGEATPTGSAKVTNNTTGANASTRSSKTTTSKPKNGKGYALDETITYDITVTNNGNQTVTNIEVVDELADAEIVPGTGYDIKNGVAVIDKLEPGHSVIVKAEYTVEEKDILAGKVANSATVTGKGPDDKPIDPDTPKSEEDPTDKPKATLNIVKTVENKDANGIPYGVGEKIAYKLTVSVGADNNVTVKDVKVTDMLLTAENVKSGIVDIKGGYTLNENNEIELGDMAPKAGDVVIEYTYTVQESDLGENGQYGNVHNAATAAGTTPKLDPDNPNPKPENPTKSVEEDTPTKIKLVITADSASKAYDGTPLTKDSYTSGQLAEGHKIDSVTITGSITEVGSTSNVASNAVIKAGEKDVTSHYDIEYKDGTLKITKGDIKNYVTLTPANVEKVYDGKTYTSGTATATDSNGNALKIEYSVDGEKWTTDPSTITATNVADSKTIQVRVSSEGNYEGYVTGTQKLTITQRSVTLTSEGGSKEYDGTALTKPKVTIGGDGFVEGEVSDVKATGSVTFVSDGEVTNTINYTPGEKFNADNYSIEKTEGKLSITKRTEVIIITTPTRTRAYNGDRLVDYQTDHTGTILEGERLVVNFPADAGLTDVGSKPNEYASYYVERISDGKDVTANYTFGEPVIGTLEVTPVAIELTANSASKAYDGEALTDSGYKITKGEFVKRREKIDGKYVDVQEGLAKVTVVGSQTVVGNSANKITGHTLNSETKAKNYSITYVDGELKVTQNKKVITVTANSHTWEYDGQPHSDGGYKVEYDGKTYTAAADGSVTLPNGDVVTATVDGTVTNVADSKDGNNKVTDVTITKDGEDRKGQYATITPVNGTLTITPRTLTISINRASKPYNGTMQDVRNPEAAEPFTDLEYTYTGLADTDTISYLDVVYGTDKNTSGQKYAGTYEAVIGEENGKKSLQIVNKETKASVLGNYTVVVNNGELIITQAQIEVSVVGGDGETVYNGKLQTLPVITNIKTSGTPPVITPGNDRYIVVTGLMGDDTLVQGTLRYLLAGTDANCTQPDKDHVIPGKEIEGKFIDPDGNAYSNNSKTYDADELRPTVLNGNEDVSANYVFTYHPGNFYIKPRPVTITAADGSWTYDAQRHTESGVNAEPENGDTGLVSGHTAKATMTEDSWIIDAGTKENVIKTVKITANGVDVTANYVITPEEGTLKVFRRGDPDDPNPEAKPVKIIAADNEVGYDGEMHGAKKNDKDEIVEGDSFTKENFVEGHTVKAGTVSITGEAKLVGTYEKLLVPGTEKSVVILDKDNNDVTKNYYITFVEGKLTITGEEIDKPEKKYDDTRKYDLGDEIPFTITVTNVSKTTVGNVTVTEQADAKIIAGDGYKVENGVAVIESLAPEETVIVNAVHIVTADDLEKFWNENQGYENNALITWPNGTREAHAEVEEFEDPTYTYDLTKEIYPSADHPDITKPYYKDEVVTFKITVKNTGNMRQTIELTEDSIGLNGVMPDLEKTTVTVDPGKSESVSATVKIDETILAIRNGDAFNRIWADNGKGKDDSRKFADATLPLPALHKLTIKYVLENGNPIPIDPASAWKYEIELRAGEKYSRLSPVLNNLETDTPLVEGVMPDHDLEITVIYTGNGGGGDNPGGGGGEEEPKKETKRDTTIRIRDYETPLGLSNVFMNAGDCFE